MIIDYVQTEDGAEGSVELPLFGCTVELLANGGGTRADVEVCDEALASLPASVLSDLLRGTALYRASATGPSTSPQLLSEAQLLGELTPLCLVVWPDGEGTAYGVEFDCSWAREHGLEWYLFDGNVVYVGPAIGGDPRQGRAAFDPNFAH